MVSELTIENATDFLVSLGISDCSDVVDVEMLGWGISNTLVKVTTEKDSFVLKQSLPQLRVDNEWLADRDRIYREKHCIETLSEIFGNNTIPRVYGCDVDNFLFVMSCGPHPGVNWKESLLSGRVDPTLAYEAGRILSKIHDFSFYNENIASQFIEDKVFRQLRIDPYYYFTAKQHPDLEGLILDAASTLLNTKSVLVHGDYSPKNFIVGDQGLFLLDFEVVHYGHPLFDIAFMLNHLILKAIHNPLAMSSYIHSIQEYVRGYEESSGIKSARESLNLIHSEELIKQIGCLMLARIDGKSPVEYIVNSATQSVVREIAKAIICGQCSDLNSVIVLVSDEV